MTLIYNYSIHLDRLPVLLIIKIPSLASLHSRSTSLYQGVLAGRLFLIIVTGITGGNRYRPVCNRRAVPLAPRGARHYTSGVAPTLPPLRYLAQGSCRLDSYLPYLMRCCYTSSQHYDPGRRAGRCANRVKATSNEDPIYIDTYGHGSRWLAAGAGTQHRRMH